MKLHTNKELFSDAVKITAQEMQLPPIYIEKDYWSPMHSILYSLIK